MVAIVSGNSLGLSLSSLATLGQRGVWGSASQGRNGEQAYVNVATGNLVLQDRDDVLVGRGLDLTAVRTYNSQGLLNDDNADNWAVGAFGQRIVLSGTVATAGSTLTRTDRDGAQAVYAWDAGKGLYISPAGAGAFDTIAHDATASRFIWTDGDTGMAERYQSTGQGRLMSASDASGNTVSYAYNANGTVQSVTDANGEVTYYDYNGTQLTQIRTVTSGGASLTRVHYGYDAGGRLSAVTVDLTPEDNSIADGQTYVTRYTYDGASNRVASVTQSDGTQLSFTYVQAGGAYKVATVTDVLGAVTRFAYDTAQNTTTVTDPLGAQSVYLYDAQGQLTQVRSGVTATNPSGLSQVSYVYDAAGNVTLITDGEGHKVSLQYDDHGNLTREVDSAGDTRVRTYNSVNQLLTDTIYADAAVVDRGAFNKDAALPETTRYVYAAGNANRLRFAITPQGNVTEYRYDAYGQRTSAIKYAGAAYNTAALALTEVPTEAQLGSWAAAQDLTHTELTELVYDARGQLSKSTTYASTATNGSGVASTAATTQYIYDPRGLLLLQKIEPATTAGGSTAITTYTYDGLGRVLSVSAPSLDGGTTPNTTITSYDDTNGKTSVTIANGLVTISAYDKAGRLVSVTQQSAGTGVLGTTTYAYDKDGNLLMTQDPTGVRKWMLYDEVGRKIADIDATGAVIEYVYNGNGQLRETIAYATRIVTTNLIDGAGRPTTAWAASNTATSLAALRPATMAQDQKVWRFYDAANRLAWQVDALGYVTQTTYDGASRVLAVTQLANPVDVTKLGNGSSVQFVVDPSSIGGVTLGISPAATVALGNSITLTATVVGTTPGGMVTFFNGTTILGSAMVLNGTASLTTAALTLGSDSITAAYSGDIVRPASVTPVSVVTVTPAVTSANLSIFPLYGVTYGTPVAISASLQTSLPAGLVAATGVVSFYRGTTLIGTAAAINGWATLTTTLPVGTSSIRAEYAGDASHTSAVSANQSIDVAAEPTTTTLQVVSSGTETALALTARVSTASGAVPADGGVVTFYNGTIVMGTATLAAGVATLLFTGTTTPAAFKAIYAGDASTATSNTLGPSGIIVASPTTATLSASATSVTQGDAVTLIARVAGAAPGGLVTFFADKQILGTATVSNGQAVLVTSYLPVGVNVVLSAAYGGDTNNAASVQALGPVLQVAAGSSSVSAPATNAPGVYFSAQTSVVAGQVTSSLIYPNRPYADPYPGMLSIFDGSTLIASMSNISRRPINLPALTAGTHNLTFIYSDNTGQSADVLTQQVTVTPAATTLSFTAPVSTAAVITAGSPFTVSVAVLTSNGVTSNLPATGTVTFYDHGAVLATVAVVNGTATWTTPAGNALSVGMAYITASYSGDANFASAATSTSTSTTQIVQSSSQALQTSTTLTVGASSATYGFPLTLTVVVSASYGQTTPTGTVNFYNGITFLGTGTVVNGKVNFVTSQLTPGTATLRAEYVGDANNAPSVGSRFYFPVAAATTSSTLSVSATSITQGQPTTLTLKVTGGLAPGGTASFFAGTQFLGSAIVVDGQASLVTSSLPAGSSVALSASYGGDASNVGSVTNGATAVQVSTGSPVAAPAVAANGVSASLLSGYTYVMAGYPMHMQVYPTNGPANASYTGSFSVFDGQKLIASFANPTGGAVIVPGPQSVGGHSFTFFYSGDSTHPAGTTTIGIQIYQIGTSVTVSTSSAQVAGGAAVTFTATLQPNGNASEVASANLPPAGGTVTFYSGSTMLGTSSIVNGVATLTTSSLPVGASRITASYTGDANYVGLTQGNSSGVYQSIVASPSATSSGLIASGTGTQPYGIAFQLTDYVRGEATATGSVSFYDGAVLLGSATIENGKAVFTVSNATPGAHNYKSVYAGDASSLSSTATVTVNVATATSSLVNCTPASVASNAALSVQVNGASPDGLVSFYDGATLIGTAQVANGLATLSGVSLPAGTRNLIAVYAGDALNSASTLQFTQVITGLPVTTIYAPLDIQQDRTITKLYNRDGHLQGSLDAEGYLTEYKYDAAGKLAQTTRYTQRAADFASASVRIAAIAIARASYNLSGLRPNNPWAGLSDINTYYFYDAQGRVVGQVDGEGFLTESVYDTRGNVIRSVRYYNPVGAVGSSATLESLRPRTYPLDQITTQTWDDGGQLVSRANAEGSVTQFTYNGVGQLVQTTTAVGTVDERTSRALYDIQGRLIGELDGRGSEAIALSDPFALWTANGVTHTYDAAGRRTSTTDANGHRTLFFYDPIGRLTYIVNALGEVTESRYSAQGQLSEQVVYGTRVNVVTLGATTPGGLNTATLAGQLAAVASAAKDTHVLHTYNATGTEASRTDALGSTTIYSYNAFREVIASSYALKNGYVVTNTSSWDRRGLNLQSAKDVQGGNVVQVRSYDAFGRLTDINGDGRYEKFSYDRAGRVIYAMDSGRLRRTTYDAFDRVLTQWDYDNNTTIFRYSDVDRSVTVTSPEGVTMTTVHNRQGQTQSVKDGRGNVTVYIYDRSGNLVRTDAPLGVSTNTAYDKTGLKLTTTDANGVVTNYTYDAVNRLLTRSQDPVGLNLTTSYAYDAKGQSISVTDPKGIVTTTAYDLDGQVVRQTVDPTGLSLQTVYAYDTNGTTLTVTSPGGTVTRYTYDGAGRRVMEQVDPNGLNLTRQYAYDDQSRLVRLTDANGNVTRYFYLGYDMPMYVVDGMGSVTENVYDNDGRVVRVIVYATPVSTAGLTDTSTYSDVHGRINFNGDNTTQSRRYDRDGRLSFTVDGTGAVVQYTYDKANNVIETRAYANRINLADWNIAINPLVTADAARDERVRTVYDALNRAIWKVDGAGNVRQSSYDANGNVVEVQAYANALSATAFANWNGTSAPPIAADATRDQRIRTVYDTANRATWSVDALGDVTQYTYDAGGNVVSKRGYATPLTAAALAAWDGHAAPTPVADDAHDRRVRNAYDAANRLTWSVDGIGAVSRNEYDANGNLTRRTQYATPVAEGVDPASVAISAADRTTTYLYDAANRQSWRVDASGAVTQLQYDGNGNVVDQRAYANPVSPGAASSATSLASTVLADDAHDVRIRNAYDAAGRLAWQADGTGAVTGLTYDGAGRLVRKVQYATAIGAGASPSSVVAGGADRIAAMAYDGAGHRTFTVDALGGVTRSVYDAFGNVTQQTAYANPIVAPSAATTYTDAALQGAVLANVGADRIQRVAYDQANRQVFVVDALGAVIESVYDGLGQPAQSRKYAQAINVAGLSSNASVSDIRSRTVVDAVNDRVTRQVFDAGGRDVYSIDPLGFVTRTNYDGLGQVQSTTQYALSIPANTANTATAIAGAVVAAPDDRSKSSQYDAAGRVLSSIDAMGFTQAWSYDALGNKTSYTNAKGSVWTYGYDLSGRMVQEISPEVELTAVMPGADGRLQVNAGASGTGRVVTQIAYDALGNLRQRTEAVGRPEQRTTTYVYDQVGRQVKVIYPPVGVYNPSSDAFIVDGIDSRHDTIQTLFTETTYDALGNAVANRDIGGNYSYKTYDLVGRVAYEVDALGFASGYQRSAFGDATVLTRYNASTGLAAGNPASLSTAQVQGAVNTQDGANRTILSDYDRLGRAVQVKEPTVGVYDSSLAANEQYMVSGKTTRNTYNTFGELTQVALQKSASNWTLSTNFYDRRGQQVASVDALGYVTKQAFDAGGNVVWHSEYANAAAGWTGLSVMAGWTGAVNAGGTAPTPALNASDDRTTTAVYDRNNRKTSETRLNVEFSTASNGTSTRGDLITSYGYDAVGNLTSTTDAKGAVTYSYYDALGRVTAVAEPTRTSTTTGAAITPLTVFRRDAYGNVVLKTEYVNGADANGNALSPNGMPGHVAIANPDLVSLRGAGYVDINDIGYVSATAFPGSKPLYRLQGTFYSWINAYTSDESERAIDIASGVWKDGGVVGYVADAEQPGTLPLYRFHQFSPPWAYTQLVSDPGAIAALEAAGWGDKKLMGYVSATPTATLDAPLHHMQLAVTDPLLGLVGAQNHIYLPGTINVAPDPVRDADLYARTDRTSYAQYDALGHTVQSTDAMGVNHYSSYNSQGLIAKEWQGVKDNAGTTRTLYRAYGYDALGHQTHIYDPGTATDGTDYTQGAAAANGAYTTRPRAVVTPGTYGSGEGGNPVPSPGGSVPSAATYGSVALSHLANLVNAAGGPVQVQFDFITPSYEVAGGENTGPSTVAGHPASYSRTFPIPGEVLGPNGVTVSPDNEPIGSVTAIRILQWNGTAWVTLWQGSPADATGQDTLNVGAGVSGAKVDTALEYNAFGELTAKRVNGQLGEYFDYDKAGRMWRTNAGDGVDKIALYDLQGRQTADIRSAGSGRGDINLRNAADAQQVAQLSDVRRTDTTYDLIGHVLIQTLPERKETQGGVSVGTDALVGGIAARAVHGDGGWSGSNTVNLGWNALAGLGSGDVRVDLYYIPVDAQGNEGPEQVRSQIFNATQGNGGASVSWSPAAGDAYGGIGRISRVVVAKKDLQANWQTLISQNGVGYSGQSLQVASPDDPNAWVQVQYRLAGSNGAWSELATVRFGDAARGDLSGLALGNYEYQAITHAPGQSDRTTSTGTFNITPRPLATLGVAGVNGSAQTLEWQGPGSGDLQTIRVRAVGGGWSAPWGINRAAGSDWSSINLSGLGAGLYEYEILWTHPGEAGPYAHATGQINKVDGTPGTPGTPTQGLPHIDGLYVESRQEKIGDDEQTGPIYQTVYVVRVPGPPPGLISSFGIRVKGSGSAFLPLAVQLRSDFGWEVRVKDTPLLPGIYEYVYGFFPGFGAPATAQALGDLALYAGGSMSIADTTPPYVPGTPGTPATPPQYGWGATDNGPYPISQDPLLGGRAIGQNAGLNNADRNVRPIVLQNVDRWGNVVSITDPRSTAWKTTYTYNANNQVVRQVQTDADGNVGIDANGNVNTSAPITQIYYDQMGRQVAVRDANGNVNGQEWDAGGDLVRELHADGNGVNTGVVSHAYNAFGNKVRTVDAEHNATAFVFDKLNHLVRTTFESVGISQTQRWDQAGRMLSQTNGNNETIRYDYDLRGNLIKTTQPLGQSTQAGYDALNRKVIEMDGNGALATWKYDYFGQLQGHSDIGGANYAYSYDNARQLIAQSNSRGQNRVYGYDAAGQQTRIQDLAIGQTSSYRYDLSGRRVRETTVQGGVTYQDNHIAYDALGRMRWVADARAYVTVDYDKVGNRTHIHTHVIDADVSALPPDSDRYFQYDTMNRQILADSATADGSYLGPDGHRLRYDYNGRRVSDKHEGIRIVQQGDGQWAAQAGGESEEVYGYDGMNRLTSTTRDGVLVDARTYDGASRVLTSTPGNLDAGYIALHTQYQGVTGSDPLQLRQSQYDANGRVIGQTTLAYVSPLVNPSGRSFSGVTYSYDDAGNVLGYVTANADLQNPTFVTTVNTVQRAEGYKQLTSFSQTRPATGPLAGTVTAQGLVGYNYDVNGFLAHTGDPGNLSVTQNHFFVNDANGTALYAYYGDPANPIQGQRQLVVNGEVLGRYGWVPDQLYAGVNFPVPGYTPYTQKASFSFGYQPINGNYPAGTPGTYAVGASDTLQSIAKGAYGDANLWYLIADANGLGGNAELRVGQVLTVPARVSSANNSATFKPYDPSKIMEGTNPTMMAMPQAQDKGCGAVGQIIMVVVAIVVTIYTAGAASGATGGFLSTMQAGAATLTGTGAVSGAAAVAVGAGSAAVGSMVSQGVGIAIGAQDSFSWKSVALAAIGGGVSAGLAGGVIPSTNNVIFDAAIRGAAGNAITQGIAVATGLQQSFSWRSVAAGAVGAGVGAAVGGALGMNSPGFQNLGFEEQFGKRLVTGLAAGAATAAMRGGHISAAQVAVDAFGNALGDSLARSSVSGGGGYDDAWRDQNLDRMKVLAGQSLAGDYVSPNGASGLSLLPQVALGISAINASVAGADAAIVSSAARSVGGTSTYGPMTSVADGINGAGQPYYIWNAEGTRSDAIAPQGQDGWGMPVSADDIALVAGVFGRTPAIPAAPMAQWNAAENSSPVVRGTTIGQVQAGGIDVRGGPSSLAAQGVKFGRLPGQQLTPFQRELGTFAQDIPKMPGNIAVGVAEAGINLLWGAIPGSPDYVPYLDALRVPYGSPVSPYAEFGLGLSAAVLARANAPSSAERGTALVLGDDVAAAKQPASRNAEGLASGVAHPVPRVDVSNRFVKTPRGDGGFDFDLGDPTTHGLQATINKNGTLAMDIRANPKLAATEGSGTDMAASLMNRLKREGLEVNQFSAQWMKGSQEVSANYAYYNRMRYKVGDLDAARGTWTGQFFSKYGFDIVTPPVTVNSPGRTVLANFVKVPQ